MLACRRGFRIGSAPPLTVDGGEDGDALAGVDEGAALLAQGADGVVRTRDALLSSGHRLGIARLRLAPDLHAAGLRRRTSPTPTWTKPSGRDRRNDLKRCLAMKYDVRRIGGDEVGGVEVGGDEVDCISKKNQFAIGHTRAVWWWVY